MKRANYILVAFMLTASLATACVTVSPGEKEAKQKAVEEKVLQALKEKHYTIDVYMMYPQGRGGISVTSDYSVEVKGDTLVSYLPYFGRAYQVPYGGGKGLNFTEQIEHYSAKRDDKGRTTITIELTNDEDTYTYILTIFENGKATVDVRSEQREPISYSGELSF